MNLSSGEPIRDLETRNCMVTGNFGIKYNVGHRTFTTSEHAQTPSFQVPNKGQGCRQSLQMTEASGLINSLHKYVLAIFFFRAVF